MRRKVVAGSIGLALLVCLASSAGAQVRFGATAGLNMTSLSGDAPANAQYNRATGFGAGLLVDFMLTEDVALSVQPMYVQRGTNIAYKVGEEEPRDSLEVRNDYIDCLVLAKVFTDSERFYVSGGFGFGFLTGANLNNVNGGDSDVKSLFTDYDMSVVLGLGYVIPARNTLLTVELRYQQSLLSVADPDELATESGLTPRMRFSGFQVFASVMFPRNHK